MKSPKALRAYTYGPPVFGYARPSVANTSASSMAPMPVKTHARIDTGPAVPAIAAGKRKIPEPTMLPITRAVAIQRPMERFRPGLSTSPLAVP